MGSIRRLWRADGGNAAIEFALAGPALLLLVLGIVEFGRMTFTYHLLADSARNATRYAIVHGAKSASPASVSTLKSLITSEAPAVQAGEIAVSYQPDNNPGSQVTITITHTFTFVIAYLSHLAPALVVSTSAIIAQ